MTSNVVEAKYTTVNEFKRDVLLVFSNCETWLHTEGTFYDQSLEEDAKTLRKKFVSYYDARINGKRKNSGPATVADSSAAQAGNATGNKKKTVMTDVVSAAEDAPSSGKKKLTKITLREKYLWCIEKLKRHFVVGPYGKVYTAVPFLKAVDPTKYAGYAELVLHPMDLSLVEKKVTRGMS